MEGANWKLRRRDVANSVMLRPVARMYNAFPAEGERFYLRVLLNHVTGATCYADVRTYEGTEHATYKDACVGEPCFFFRRCILLHRAFVCIRRLNKTVVHLQRAAYSSGTRNTRGR